MSDPKHIIEAGASVTAAGIATGFLAVAIPVLQFCSLVVGLVAGILTAIYTWRRIKHKKYD